MTNDENFTFGHYSVDSGYATVAGGRVGNKIYYGISFCSPDSSFSKEEGRKRAMGHLIERGSSHKRGVFVSDNLDEMAPSLVFYNCLQYFLNRKHTFKKPIWMNKIPTIDFQNKKARKYL
jgi:hypothetical protein